MGKTRICLQFITLNTVGHAFPCIFARKAGRHISDSFSLIILSYYYCLPVSMELSFVNWCYCSWALVLFVKYICYLFHFFSLCIYNKLSIYKLSSPQQVVNVSLDWSYIHPILMRRVLIKICCYLSIFQVSRGDSKHIERVFLIERVLRGVFIWLITMWCHPAALYLIEMTDSP